MPDSYTILVQRHPAPAFMPPFCQPGFFFNEGIHLSQQDHGAFYFITALNLRTQRAEARCAFFAKLDAAVSPVAAPFGSVEFAETLPDSVLDELIRVLIDEARATGVPTLRLVNYPHCYAPTQADRLTGALIARNFRLIRNDSTAFLAINGDGFAANLPASARRRLRKCQRAGFRFQYNPEPDIGAVVGWLRQTRQRQGYALTLSPDRLIELLNRFPDQFPVFSVMDGDVTAALTVAVRVRADILYAFLPASHPDYHRFSPMVLLTDGLFTYCRQGGIRLLDLGVSLDADRQPKPSLMRFKRNLGAQVSPKLVFEKDL